MLVGKLRVAVARINGGDHINVFFIIECMAVLPGQKKSDRNNSKISTSLNHFTNANSNLTRVEDPVIFLGVAAAI